MQYKQFFDISKFGFCIEVFAMDERYIKNIGPLSQFACSELLNKKFFVAGCGGLGGYIIEMLLRLGVSHITVADGDTFSSSNLNRQLYSDLTSIGALKVKSAQNRAAAVNPEVSFIAVPDYISENNAEDLISGHDIVFDALDNFPARRVLYRACKKQNIPCIYGAVEGWVAACGIAMPDDDFLDKVVGSGNIEEETPRSVLSFTPAVAASLQVSLGVKLLCNLPHEKGKLYYFDLLHCDLTEIF